MPICIAGMGRSGTSMCAHLLAHAGVYLGPEQDLMAADSGNRDGYWENIHFVAINDVVLHTAGGAWDAPPNVLEGWQKWEDFQDARIKAISLIGQFAPHDLWGWKDPRNSLTAPFWQDLIPDLRFVICVRNPLEVALSLRKRWGFSVALGLNLWREYNARVLDYVLPERRVVTHYAAYFAEPDTELRRLMGALRIHASDAATARVRATITPELRGAHFTMRDLADGGVARSEIDLYARLCAEASWDDAQPTAPAEGQTDSFWHAVWHSTPLPVTPERQHVEELERDRARLQSHLDDIERDRTDLRAHLAKTTDHLEDVERDRAQLGAHLEHTVNHLDDVERDRTDLRAYIVKTAAHLDDVERDRADLRAHLESIVAHVTGVEQDHADLGAHLTKTVNHLEDMERDRADLRAHLESIVGHLADVERDRADLGAHLAKTADHLEDVERDRADLHEHLAAAVAQLHDVEGDRNQLREYHATILDHLHAVEQDRTDLRAHLATLVGHLEDVERDRDRVQNALTDATRRLRIMEQEHAHLHGSLTVVAASLREIARDRNDQRARAEYLQREYDHMTALAAAQGQQLEAMRSATATHETQTRDQERVLARLPGEIDALREPLKGADRLSSPPLFMKLRAAIPIGALGILVRTRNAATAREQREISLPLPSSPREEPDAPHTGARVRTRRRKTSTITMD